MDGEYGYCPKHRKHEDIVASGTNPGFSGAPIFWMELTCGAYVVDLSQDTLEATR